MPMKSMSVICILSLRDRRPQDLHLSPKDNSVRELVIVPVCCSSLEYTISNVIGPALASSGCEERGTIDLQIQTRVEDSKVETQVDA